MCKHNDDLPQPKTKLPEQAQIRYPHASSGGNYSSLYMAETPQRSDPPWEMLFVNYLGSFISIYTLICSLLYL